MKYFEKILLSLCLLVVATLANADDFKLGDIHISTPYIRVVPASAELASGYMDIHNQGAEADQLLEVRSALTERIEIHEMRIENEVMRMRPLPEGLALPAGEVVSLAPGGYHLMIFEPSTPLIKGEKLSLELRFAKAGTIEVLFDIKDIVARGATQREGTQADDGHHHHKH